MLRFFSVLTHFSTTVKRRKQSFTATRETSEENKSPTPGVLETIKPNAGLPRRFQMPHG